MLTATFSMSGRSIRAPAPPVSSLRRAWKQDRFTQSIHERKTPGVNELSAHLYQFSHTDHTAGLSSVMQFKVASPSAAQMSLFSLHFPQMPSNSVRNPCQI